MRPACSPTGASRPGTPRSELPAERWAGFALSDGDLEGAPAAATLAGRAAAFPRPCIQFVGSKLRFATLSFSEAEGAAGGLAPAWDPWAAPGGWGGEPLILYGLLASRDAGQPTPLLPSWLGSGPGCVMLWVCQEWPQASACPDAASSPFPTVAGVTASAQPRRSIPPAFCFWAYWFLVV